jgi:tetratricopeptide (TPR) repeat protein
VLAAREQGRLGMNSLHEGNLAEAEARFNHAIERCPKDCNLRHDFSGVLWRRGKRSRAIQEMNKALKDSKEQPEWTVELGEMQLESGNMDEALASTERALRQDAQLANAWKLRGDILRKKGDLQSALHDYHRALTLQPESLDILMEIADVYRAQGRPRRALATLDRVSESATPDNRPPKLEYLQGLALQAMGRSGDAIEFFLLAKKNDNHPDITLRLAEAQWAAGQYDEARKSALSFAERRPEDQRVAGLMAALQNQADRLNGSVSSTY